MTGASDARERFEAEAWQILGEYSAAPRVHHVDRLLTLADQYAHAEAERIRQARRDLYASTQPGDTQPCGTVGAAMRHRRHGDVPDGKKLRDVCAPCADAEAAVGRHYRRQAAGRRPA